jgi:hypothetical protein
MALRIEAKVVNFGCANYSILLACVVEILIRETLFPNDGK